MDENRKFEKRIERIRTVSIVCLIISLFLTVVVWAASFVKISGNTITFGKIDIDIGYFEGSQRKYFAQETDRTLFNDTKIFNNEREEVFFIENKGNMDAWYRIYLDDIEGTYGYVLRVYIDEIDDRGSKNPVLGYAEPLYAVDFIKSNDSISRVGSIRAGEIKKLNMRFETDIDRLRQLSVDTEFKFDIYVDAVQMKNNP